MSNYIRRTKHPKSGEFEDASWFDDYYGQHQYGVKFPSEPHVVYKESAHEWEFDDRPMNPDDTTDNRENIILLAVNRALRGGWKIPFEEPIISVEVADEDINGTYQTEPYIRFELDGSHDWTVGIEKIIYDHKFAEALWGTVNAIHRVAYFDTENNILDGDFILGWEYHLSRMVIADDPVQYMEDKLALIGESKL